MKNRKKNASNSVFMKKMPAGSVEQAARRSLKSFALKTDRKGTAEGGTIAVSARIIFVRLICWTSKETA